jgi:DNA-binding response OmpR family regulator
VVATLNIIVVEDHDSLREVTVALLNEHGYQAVGLANAEAVDDEAGGRVADLYIIDLNLPGEDGICLARRIRSAHAGVGIIMVTARMLAEDKVQGYASGADIYLPKPVGPGELLAAIGALARRVKPPAPASAVTMTLDQQRLVLRGPLLELHLANAEATLLRALVIAPGQRLAYWQINEALGQLPDELNKASLEVRMVRLRKKLMQASGDDAALRSIRGHGYQLCVPLSLF